MASVVMEVIRTYFIFGHHLGHVVSNRILYCFSSDRPKVACAVQNSKWHLMWQKKPLWTTTGLSNIMYSIKSTFRWLDIKLLKSHLKFEILSASLPDHRCRARGQIKIHHNNYSSLVGCTFLVPTSVHPLQGIGHDTWTHNEYVQVLKIFHVSWTVFVQKVEEGRVGVHHLFQFYSVCCLQW